MKKIITGLVFALLIPCLSFATPVTKIDTESYEIDLQSTTSLWEGYQFGKPGEYAEYFDDFFKYAAGDWTITTTENGGGSATEALADSVGGVLRITLDNSLNDADGLQLGAESFLPAVGKRIFCEFKIQTSDATDTQLVFGLVNTDTSPAAHTNGIVFNKDDTSTSLNFDTTASSVTSTEAAIGTVADDTYITGGFKVVGTKYVEYWVNGGAEGSFTSNVPTTELRPTVYFLNGTENEAETLDIDHIYCAQEK